MKKIKTTPLCFITYKLNSNNIEEQLVHNFAEDDDEFIGLWKNHFWYDVCEYCNCLVTDIYGDEILKEPEQLHALIDLIEAYQNKGCDYRMLIVLKEFAKTALKHKEKLYFSLGDY
jgi:hypothetical protein